jgi:hypothetical protein
MNNAEDILKKILLNMRYDPRKSLKENNASLKRNLTEGCIPLDTKLETYSDSEDGSRNKPRNITYPELGKWGDGNCKCKKNSKCLEFKKSCCTGKTGVVSLGDLEQERIKDEPTTDETPTTEIKYVQHVGALGNVLVVPEKTKILSRSMTREELEVATIEKYGEWYKDLKKGCETTRSNDAIKCLQEFKDKQISLMPQGRYVISFQLPNGEKYDDCFTVYDSNGFVPVEKQTFFDAYYTSCKPLGIKYESPNQNLVTKKSEDGANSITPITGKEILNKRLKGTNTWVNDAESYDNEGEMLFQLGSGSE